MQNKQAGIQINVKLNKDTTAIILDKFNDMNNKIKEANSLAHELTSLLKNLKLEIQM